MPDSRNIKNRTGIKQVYSRANNTHQRIMNNIVYLIFLVFHLLSMYVWSQDKFSAISLPLSLAFTIFPSIFSQVSKEHFETLLVKEVPEDT